MADPMVFDGLAKGGWNSAAWEPFREGVEIAHLWRDGEGAPAAALLRYAPGASVPRHLHPGLETIVVLEGSQSDERGTYGPGTVVFNPEGTRHSVWSEEGCVILIQWNRPVVIGG